MTEKAAVSSYLVNGSAALFGFLTVEYIAVGIGIFLGVLTYCTSLYFHRLKNAREIVEQARKAEMHELLKAQIRAEK